MTIEQKKKEIGELLYNVRSSNGISQTKICKDSGLHHIQLKGIEDGTGNYNINVLLCYISNIGKIPFSALKSINKVLTC